MSALLTRRAAIADIPFLARIQYESALPPLNYCFWEDMLPEGTSALQFIEAMLRAEASNWGDVANFLILEENGQPIAAAAGYEPNPENYCPLSLSRLDAIADHLHWTSATTAEFHQNYERYWGGDYRPIFLTPQAPWIIEYVAVLPEGRGRGLGKVLLKAVLEEGRSQEHSHAGIMVVNGNDTACRTYESLGFKLYLAYYADYFKELYKLDFPGVTKFGLCLTCDR
jgi:GNAT superfamily N-acetyltransferase